MIGEEFLDGENKGQKAINKTKQTILKDEMEVGASPAFFSVEFRIENSKKLKNEKKRNRRRGIRTRLKDHFSLKVWPLRY